MMYANNGLEDVLLALILALGILWLQCIVFKKIHKKKGKTNTYDVQYRAYLKMFGGGTRETDIINVTIPAIDEADLKQQLQKYVSENIKVEIVKVSN